MLPPGRFDPFRELRARDMDQAVRGKSSLPRLPLALQLNPFHHPGTPLLLLVPLLLAASDCLACLESMHSFVFGRLAALSCGFQFECPPG